MSKEAITPEQVDIRMLIACRSHVASKNITTHMTPYAYGRMEDGSYVFNPKMTLEKIRLAARIICGIENPADVCVVSSRVYGQRAVLKFAKYTGATALPTKFTPGTFTNQIQKKFLEPRLLIITDPITDHQAIMESSYVNIPVIAICDSDSPLRYIDVAIPANNKGVQQIGIIYWMLAREVLRIRGTISYKKEWDVMPDLFFYRESTDHKQKEEEEEFEEEETGGIIAEGAHDRRTATIPEEEIKAEEKAQKEARKNWATEGEQNGSAWGDVTATSTEGAGQTNAAGGWSSAEWKNTN